MHSIVCGGGRHFQSPELVARKQSWKEGQPLRCFVGKHSRDASWEQFQRHLLCSSLLLPWGKLLVLCKSKNGKCRQLPNGYPWLSDPLDKVGGCKKESGEKSYMYGVPGASG